MCPSAATTSDVKCLREARESEQRLLEVLENSLDAVYRRDLRADTYDYMSSVIESITGYTPAEFTGFSLEETLDRIHPDDVERVRTALPLALESGTLMVEYRLRRNDGQYVWLADNAVFTKDEAGNPVYITGVVRDVSLQKRSESELLERARYAESLNRINDALHSTLDINEILHRTVVEATTASGLDATAIHVHEEGHWRFAYSYGLREEVTSARLRDDEAPLSMWVLESQKTLIVQDKASDPAASDVIRRFDIGDLIAVPLIVRGEVLAVLFAGRRGEVRGFSPVQVDFMVNIAATLSLALANARMYQAEHMVAETLQEALLAMPERVNGIAFAHAYRSAAEAVRVGGDFYDIFEIEHDAVGVVIGDVAGKGLQAAVLTSLLRNSIRAHAADKQSPAAVLSLTNDLVFRHTGLEAFATVFFAMIDRQSGSMVYCNAGHTSPTLVSSSGEVTPLGANSPIVGAFAEATFRDDRARLELDELLFLYTDGLTEARRDGDFYGEQRLFNLIAATRDGVPARIVRAVVDDVLEFAQGRLADDLALLSVKRLIDTTDAPRQQKLEM